MANGLTENIFSFMPGQPREKWLPCHNTYLAKINRKSIIIIVVKCAANGIARISCGQLRRQQQILAHHAHLANNIEHFCRISSNCAIRCVVVSSTIIELPSTSGFLFCLNCKFLLFRISGFVFVPCASCIFFPRVFVAVLGISMGADFEKLSTYASQHKISRRLLCKDLLGRAGAKSMHHWTHIENGNIKPPHYINIDNATLGDGFTAAT